MRVNEYNSILDFIGEYAPFFNNKYQRFWGLEFFYKDKMYRLACFQQVESDEERKRFAEILKVDPSCDYELSLIDDSLPQDGLSSDEYHIVGLYKDIFDLLDNCILEGKTFREVIMADETKLDSKD